MTRLTILLATLLMGGTMLLFNGCKHGHLDKDSHIEFATDYLNEILDLNESQQAQLESIKNDLMPEFTALQEARQKIHPMLKEQLASDKIDTAVIKQAIADHRLQLDQVIDHAVDRFAEFHATLSPEQRQKLIGKLEKMEKWHNCQVAK